MTATIDWPLVTNSAAPSLADRAAFVARVIRLAESQKHEDTLKLLDPLWPDAMRIEPVLALYYALGLVDCGRSEDAVATLETAEPWVRATRDASLLRRCQNLVGWAHFEAQQFRRAEELLQQALESSTLAGDLQLLCWININLGNCASVRGRSADALGYYKRSLAAAQAMHTRPRDLAMLHHLIGMTYRAVGHYADASTHFGKALTLSTGHFSVHEANLLQIENALNYAFSGEHELARELANRVRGRIRQLVEDAVSPARARAHARDLYEAERVLGVAALGAGDLTAAREHLLTTRDGAHLVASPLLEAEANEDLARVAHAAGDRDGALCHLRDAEVIWMKLGLPERVTPTSPWAGER